MVGVCGRLLDAAAGSSGAHSCDAPWRGCRREGSPSEHQNEGDTAGRRSRRMAGQLKQRSARGGCRGGEGQRLGKSAQEQAEHEVGKGPQ